MKSMQNNILKKLKLYFEEIRIFRRISNLLSLIFQLVMIITLLVLFVFSVIAIVLVNQDYIGNPLVITKEGFANYVAAYRPYRELLAATFFMLTAMLAFRQMSISNENKEITKKQNERTIWLNKVQHTLNTMSSNHQVLYETVFLKLYEIFNTLYKNNFAFKNKEELVAFFDEHVKLNVPFFEKHHKDFIKTKCYPDIEYTFTYYTYASIFLAFLNDMANSYPDLLKDFKQLYCNEIKAYIKKENIEINKESFNQKLGPNFDYV